MAVPPKVSVVIAAYHSDRVIEGCLQALRRQTCTDFETIVVNSSPGDGTREIVVAGFPDMIFVEHPTRLLPHAARNLGVARARGDALVFTDADCRAEPDWLARCLAALADGHHVVCGSIQPADGGWYALGVHLCKYSFRLGGLPPGPTAIAGTANVCYARAVWDAIGPFDATRFAGDALLGWQAARRGWRPWFEPRAAVRHVFDHSFAEFWRERIERGGDFLRARAAAENWSSARLLACALAFPVLPLFPLARGLRDAVAAGWTMRYVWTLPVQMAGHLAWSLGEARAAMARLIHGKAGASRG
jgi:glycosyltransferase involved in cell wall biosynthesis